MSKKLLFNTSIQSSEPELDITYTYYVFDTSKVSGSTTVKFQDARNKDSTSWDKLTDWGDGIIDTSTSHTYDSDGIYTVKTKYSINGDDGAFGCLLADSNTKTMLVEVLNINCNIKYLRYFFMDVVMLCQ